jgi:iron complex transport system ATP-binding protein
MTLTLESVAVDFGPHFKLEPLSAELDQAHFVGLIGPNGAGKSTLLRAMAALIDLSGGHVRLDGRKLHSIHHTTRARQIAYLAQSTPVSWPITVGELIDLGRLPHRGRCAATEDRQAAQAALRRTAMTALVGRPITELSGGEYARAQLARALCVEAPVLLADEPIAQLDPFHQLQIMDLLRQHAHAGHLVVAVLHDLALAARYCDRLLLLDAGRLVADGLPAAVLTQTRLRSVYSIDAIIESREGEPLIVPWRQRN